MIKIPVFCSGCKAFFTSLDTIAQVKSRDIYNHLEYVYYHVVCTPINALITEIMTYQALYEKLLDSHEKRTCLVCGNELESTRPDTKYCKRCSTKRLYKTPEAKREYMRLWRAKERERRLNV